MNKKYVASLLCGLSAVVLILITAVQILQSLPNVAKVLFGVAAIILVALWVFTMIQRPSKTVEASDTSPARDLSWPILENFLLKVAGLVIPGNKVPKPSPPIARTRRKNSEMPAKYAFLAKLFRKEQRILLGTPPQRKLKMRVDSYLLAKSSSAATSRRDQLCARLRYPFEGRIHVEFARQFILEHPVTHRRTRQCILQGAHLLVTAEASNQLRKKSITKFIMTEFTYVERLALYFHYEGFAADDIAYLLGVGSTLVIAMLDNLERVFESIDQTAVEQWRRHLAIDGTPPLARIEFGQACKLWANGRL